MLRQNLKVFLLFLVIIALLILFKNGQVFDLGVVFRSWLAPQGTINSLLTKPDNIEEEYKNLLAENNRLKTLAEENQQLKELLDFKKEKEYSLVVANILSRDSANRNILIIDVGRGQNIEIGQAVVVNNGIIVGKVIDVGIDSSKVRLLSDNFSKLAIKTGGEQKVSGLLTGSLGLTMDLSYVPQDHDIKKNDLVVSADLDVDIPPGLVVGLVEEVEFSQEELFKKASVSPMIDYNTLSIVAVIDSL
jgi:rod shape-determining protein MreC